MSRVQNKASRLAQIEALLLAYPQGMTQAELARRLNVDRSTINRDIADLPKHIYVDDLADGRLKIDREAYLVNVRLSLHEVLSVHLAARLLATRMDRQNKHAAGAMRKLGIALRPLAAQIGKHILQSADVLDDPNRRQDPVYIGVLEKLTLAWAEQRKVQIWHRHESDQVLQYVFSPYFIEPYAVGQATHVIGWRQPPGAMRTFKIERIERVEVMREPYEIPEDFDPRQILADAWGIWYTEREPVEVVLRFSPQAARRVNETRWHASEESAVQEDGTLIWSVRVAQPVEMLPWIRGWGADVEVLEPENLRDRLEEEVNRLAKLYRIVEGKPDYGLIAHWRKRDKKAQSLLTHLYQTSDLAEGFAQKVGLPEIGKVIGLLHDLGKASQEYQNYLRTNEGLINPDEDGYSQARRGEIDHSTAGAQMAYQKLLERGPEGQLLAQALALVIASHHSGLIDCLKPDGQNDFERRIRKPYEETHFTEAAAALPEVVARLGELLSQPIEKAFLEKLKSIRDENESKPTLAFKHGLLLRFLLSCLLDADRLNTADFEYPENEEIRNYGKYTPWQVLAERLEHRLRELNRRSAEGQNPNAIEVNQLRAQVSQACLEFAPKPKGIYQLTVPTGGGKTLASLRFAINHAENHKMDRVFYIVPYITIIDQNADDVRQTLEDRDASGHLLDTVVLEHHSNLTPEKETRRHNLLAEDWDAPIVFTTQVQFLEALFGSGTRNARRMHQLANSVIILDEVQTIPVKATNLFTTALRFLVHDCGATVVLCTATQPPFDEIGGFRKLQITQDQHIIQNETELFKKLKRVEVFNECRPDGWTYLEIADLAEHALQEKGSVLIVVNTRAAALAIYREIAARNLAETYHLSTNMCAKHRLNVLDKVKEKLSVQAPVICVSTQLIEAGVDIDFGAVIRSLAGLDSIAQSAGRCNRHGLRDTLGAVWIVNLKEEVLDRLKDIKVGRAKAQTVMDDYRESPEAFEKDLIGLKAISTYYNYYYGQREDEMNYAVTADSYIGRADDLFNLLSTNTISKNSYFRNTNNTLDLSFPQSFRSAAKSFQVIDSQTWGVIVPYDKGEQIIESLCDDCDLRDQKMLLREAQRYSVNLFSHQFNTLVQKGAIHEVRQGTSIFYLNKQFYSNDFGWSEEFVGDSGLLLA